MSGIVDTSNSSMRWVAIPLSLIALAVVAGNGLVIIAAITSKSLQTPPNLYIVSLAVVDFCVGAFILPLSILHLVNDHKWTLGTVMCEVWLTADITLCTVSIYHLIAIAINRYRTISEGIHYLQRRTFSSVFRFIILIWLVALWIAMPPVIGWNIEIDGKRDWGLFHGTCKLTQDKGFIVHSAIGTFFFPMFLMTAIYFRIYQEIKSRLHKRSQVSTLVVERSTDSSHNFHDRPDGNQTDSSADDLLDSGDEVEDSKRSGSSKKKQSTLMRLKSLTLDRMVRSSPTPPPNENHHDEEEFHPRSESNSSSIVRTQAHPRMVKRPSSQLQAFMTKKLKFSLSRERRAARTLGMIIAGFVICWLPFAFLYVINPFLSTEYAASQTVFEVFTWFGYLNSALNPIIYNVFDKDFREAFTRLLSCCRIKKFTR